MYGNLGLEAHLDVNHTIGVSMLCHSREKRGEIRKKWIMIDLQYMKEVFGNDGMLYSNISIIDFHK